MIHDDAKNSWSFSCCLPDCQILWKKKIWSVPRGSSYSYSSAWLETLKGTWRTTELAFLPTILPWKLRAEDFWSAMTPKIDPVDSTWSRCSTWTFGAVCLASPERKAITQFMNEMVMKLGSFLLELSRENVCCFCLRPGSLLPANGAEKKQRNRMQATFALCRFGRAPDFVDLFLLISESETKRAAMGARLWRSKKGACSKLR